MLFNSSKTISCSHCKNLKYHSAYQCTAIWENWWYYCIADNKAKRASQCDDLPLCNLLSTSFKLKLCLICSWDSEMLWCSFEIHYWYIIKYYNFPALKWKRKRGNTEKELNTKKLLNKENWYAMMSPTINPQSQTANLCNIASANSTNLIKT